VWTTQVDAVEVGNVYNDDYDDDGDVYLMFPYNLVVHPPALLLGVHRVARGMCRSGRVCSQITTSVTGRVPVLLLQKSESTACVSQRSSSPLWSLRLPCISARGSVSQGRSSPF
jgi:hypothetical protein